MHKRKNREGETEGRLKGRERREVVAMLTESEEVQENERRVKGREEMQKMARKKRGERKRG